MLAVARPVLFSALALSAACSEATVTLTGRIGDGPDPEAPGLAAQIEIIDFDTGERLALADSADDGQFAIELPQTRSIVALVRSDDTVTTSFKGATEFVDSFIDDGSLYGLSTEAVDQWRSDFAGCPGADARVVAFGRMEFYNITGEKSGEPAIAAGGSAEVLTETDALPACYLDPKTELYDPKSDRTQASGRFAVGDLPSGPLLLDVVFEWAPDSYDTPGLLPIWVPDTDEDVVVPYLPLRLTFPVGI